MALSNGVLMIGPTHWAVAVREGDGHIVTTSRRRPSSGTAVDRIPLLRGITRLVEQLAVLPLARIALPQARFSFEAPTILAGTIAGSIATRGLRRRYGDHGLAELASSALSVGLTLATLRGGDVARYHGAEHKVIGGYEQGIPAELASKEHPRCGTQLAVPLLVMNAVGHELARLALPGRPALARWVGMAAGIATAMEVARNMQRGGDSPPERLIGRIGIGLQSIASTSEPTPEQLDVARAALDELLVVEGLPAVA